MFKHIDTSRSEFYLDKTQYYLTKARDEKKNTAAQNRLFGIGMLVIAALLIFSGFSA